MESAARTRRARVTRRGSHGAGRLPGWPTRVPGATAAPSRRGRHPVPPGEQRVGWGCHGISKEPQVWAGFGGFLFAHTRVSPLGGHFTGVEAKSQSKPWLGTGPAAAGASCRAAAHVCPQVAGGSSSSRRYPREPRSAARPRSAVPGGAGPSWARPGRAVPAVGAGGVRARAIRARVA